jgi:hypothetical protein
MSPENQKRIQEAVAKAGDELKGKLPPLHDFPNRNSYAHVWREIKEAFGKTYKECTDDQVDEILAVIETTRLNPK